MASFTRISAAVCLAAALLLPAGLAAQITTDAAGLRAIAAGMLDEGMHADAARLAQALLRRDPEDVTALLILAEAAIATEDFDGAIAAAGRAYQLADGRQRYGAARVMALGHARLEQFIRSQIWLRRARQAAPDSAAVRELAADYRFVRERNPLNMQLNFGISPSSNVNGGSASETIILPGLPFEFVLDGEARALSGVQFSGGVGLTYRLRADADSTTLANLQFQGRTYALSDSASDLAPDARGSDYADIYLGTGLTHRWRTGDDHALQTATYTMGQTWYGGDPFTRFAILSYENDRALADRQRLALQGFVEWTERLEEGEGYPTLGVRGRWTIVAEDGNRTTLSLTLREAATELFDIGYQSTTLTANYELRAPVAGLRLGFGGDVDFRIYDNTAYSFDAREDLRGVLRVTAGLPRINLYGFEPLVTLEASQTDSNVALFDKTDLRINLGLRSSF